MHTIGSVFYRDCACYVCRLDIRCLMKVER